MPQQEQVQAQAIQKVLFEPWVLERIVAGAVRQTIDAHGLLSKRWNGSTTKRIAAQIRAQIRNQSRNEVQHV